MHTCDLCRTISREEKNYLDTCRQLVEEENLRDSVQSKKRKLEIELSETRGMFEWHQRRCHLLRDRCKRLKIASERKQQYEDDKSMINLCEKAELESCVRSQSN
jgi:hypothetical protein